MTHWMTPTPDPTLEPSKWPDMLTVAATVLGEAEGESLYGKRAVAYVIMNRAADARWPDTPGDVCLQRLQFSCWNTGSPRVPKMMNPRRTGVGSKVWDDCFRATVEAMYKLEPDPVNGANHYLAPGSLKVLPIWAKPEKIVAKIERHWFYRL